MQITQTPAGAHRDPIADIETNHPAAPTETRPPTATAPESTPPRLAEPKTPLPKTTDPAADPAGQRPALDPAQKSLSHERRIALLGGQATIDAYQLPILGSPDAASIVVEMFDYTCHHCRQLHRFMQQARQRYGSQLAIVLLPNPMNKSCNRYVTVDQPAHKEACHYAHLALAVWNVKPKSFEAYHEWLMEPKDVPTVEEARDKAAEMIGESALAAALAGDTISRQIEANGLVYHLAKRGAIPKLMTERFVAAGQPPSAEQLFQMLEKQVGVRP